VDVAVDCEAVRAWLRGWAAAVAAARDLLNELDAAIGDADHGANLDRGLKAVVAKLPAVEVQDVGAVLKGAGMTLLSTVGGASGPLYGTVLLQMAAAAAGKPELSPPELAAALRAGVDGLMRRGKAHVGEKTMVDCLAPASAALEQALVGGAPLAEALRRAERAGHQGMLDTIPLVATKGRASYLGERSRDHQDPGATSAHLLLRAAAEALGGGEA
jgi:phosphoenolpyruvate---glycerone phosphotransferase subunit DhaL